MRIRFLVLISATSAAGNTHSMAFWAQCPYPHLGHGVDQWQSCYCKAAREIPVSCKEKGNMVTLCNLLVISLHVWGKTWLFLPWAESFIDETSSLHVNFSKIKVRVGSAEITLFIQLILKEYVTALILRQNTRSKGRRLSRLHAWEPVLRFHKNLERLPSKRFPFRLQNLKATF